MSKLSPKEYWRGLILLGLNTATYKIALAKSIMNFVDHNASSVTMGELSTVFFDIYHDRLKNDKPQLILPGRLTVMENIDKKYRLGLISRDKAINLVEQNAFADVIPRFHTLYNSNIPIRFYEKTNTGLIITDSAFQVLSGENKTILTDDLNSRWDLLEAAFEIRRKKLNINNDIREFYLTSGYDRKPITRLRPTLNGYQNGVCFYCGELMGDDIHVDHVVPRQLVNHDEVWNLVLAHGFCNEQKSDFLPTLLHIEQLIHRNEFLIASNHPLKNEIVSQLGDSPSSRREKVIRVYRDAETVIGITWNGIKGYSPKDDPVYRAFVRNNIE